MNGYGALVVCYWLGKTENWERNLATLPTTNPTRTVLSLSRPTLSAQRLNACAVDCDGCNCTLRQLRLKYSTQNGCPKPQPRSAHVGRGRSTYGSFWFHFQAVSLGPPLGFVTGFASCPFVPVSLSFLSFFMSRLKPSGHYTYRQV